MKSILLTVMVLLAISGCGPSPDDPGMYFSILPGQDAEKDIQTAMITVKPGGVIELGEGKYSFTRRLSLDIENVTIKGQGMDRTILSFAEQKMGAEGIIVTKGGFTIRDLAIEDTKGDAIKVKGGDRVFFQRIRTEWTQGPSESNGAYGIYPVQCKNVLIEDCVAIAASDAGIYVGQSENIIVRRNKASKNVAGIEIENSQKADVYENEAIGNTGGILVFDLPNLPVMGGGNVRVFNNKILNNNHSNFAPKGNIVALVPPGTGVMIMANNNVEIFQNEITNHQTTNIAIVSYISTGKQYEDPKYDPYPEAIFIYENKISGGGENPEGPLGAPLRLIFKNKQQRVPDIIWDGVANQEKLVEGKLPENLRICVNGNGDATFGNIQLHFLIMGQTPQADTNIENYKGELPKIEPVVIEDLEQ